jgi:hypothetical protein
MQDTQATEIPLPRQPESWSDEDIYAQLEELYPLCQEIVDERYDNTKWNVQCYTE